VVSVAIEAIERTRILLPACVVTLPAGKRAIDPEQFRVAEALKVQVCIGEKAWIDCREISSCKLMAQLRAIAIWHRCC